MNLSHVEVIVAIAKAGSISQAAQNLYISQPAISKILQKFEEEMGVMIFERVSTGVRPTYVGQKFIEQALDIMDQLDKLKEIVTKKTTPVPMELSLASMSYQFMQVALSELFFRYSKGPIQIKYIECGFDTQVEKVMSGEVEIGVVTLLQNDLRKMIKRATAKGIEYHRLCYSDLYIAVSQHSAAYPKGIHGIDFERLSKMPLISISPSLPYKGTGWDFTMQLFRNEIKPSFQEVITNNTGTMREILNRIDGFTLVLLNEGIRRRCNYFDDIRLIPYVNTRVVFEQGWLQRANTVRSRLASDLIDMLLEYCT